MAATDGCSSVKDYVRFLTLSSITDDVKTAVQVYHDSRKSWEECVEILRSHAKNENSHADSTTLLACALTLKHHAYSGLCRLGEVDVPIDLSIAHEAQDTLADLCLLYYDRDDSVRQQLLFAICGVIINFFDVTVDIYNFMLSRALRKFDENPVLQCQLLYEFPEELLNFNVNVSSFVRADLVRGSVMYSPRIFWKLFKLLGNDSKIDVMYPLRALQKWLEMHVNLIRTYAGTNDCIYSDDQGKICKFDHDSMHAKIPRDDAILIRNGLNAIGAVGGVFTLFDKVRQSIDKRNPEVCEAACSALTQFYSLIQLDLIGIMHATSIRYNDSVNQSSRHWIACSKASISQLPCLIMDSCSWAVEFFAELPSMFSSFLLFKHLGEDEEPLVKKRMLEAVLEVLVTIAGEHIAFALLFSENNSIQATLICTFVKDVLQFQDLRCRELCLDFYTSLMGIIFAVRDSLSEPHFSTCVLRIVQTMRCIYTEFVKQAIKTVAISFDGCDDDFHRYRVLVSVFVDEVVNITGINMVIHAIQNQLKLLNEKLDWTMAESCVYLISSVAHRLTPDVADSIVTKLLKIVCNVSEFRDLYHQNRGVALYIHRSICDCLVLTCSLIVQDVELMRSAQELCLMEFCEDKLYTTHAARALRSIALCANYSPTDVYSLMKRISGRILVRDIPFTCRIELLSCITDLLGTFNESAKIRLRRDFITAISTRFNELLEMDNPENFSEDILLYLTALLIVDFRPTIASDFNIGGFKEETVDKRKIHECVILKKLMEKYHVWPHIRLCHEVLRMDKFSTPEEIDNIARWLLWLLREAHFGSSTQILVIKTILQSDRLCQQDRLLNVCMDIVDQYVSRLIGVMMQGVDTLDADVSNGCTPPNNDSSSKEGTKVSDSNGGNGNDSSSITAESEVERLTSRSSSPHVITEYIIFNANKFRSVGDLSELDVFTCAVRSGVSNDDAALKFLSWPKFGKYVTFMALLLPTNNPDLNREIIDLFVSIVVWLGKESQDEHEEEVQKYKLTRNAARAILMGKHFLQCDVTMAEFITSAVLKALLSRPIQVETWLSPATLIIHTLIASSTFYPLVANSIKSCLRGGIGTCQSPNYSQASYNKRRRITGKKIIMSNSAREIRRLLWMLATDTPGSVPALMGQQC
ncbi:hypothetical protein BgAZ_107280 [Babesia gibsoni]|uniref:Uncharacterized protein n=1 Tax=Babesia gibsoni TaxID=33632 RepID=A0AAD8UUK7_BABGI|nr:hypothetical protein BgAZ_107280 [Babesia gibsoni]